MLLRMLSNQLNLLERELRPIEIGAQLSSAELSSGLSELSGKKVLFRTDFAKEGLALSSLSDLPSRGQYAVLPFSTEAHQHLVAAVDSSCVLVGETEEGAIYAGRVAAVLAEGKKIAKYYRAGPAIIYLTPQNVRAILGSGFNSKIATLILMDRKAAERFVRIHLERKALLALARSLSNTIVLSDGALRSSSLERTRDSLKELQRTCENNNNQLAGFSKSSSLKIVAGAAAALQACQESSIYMDLTEALRMMFPLACGVSTRIVAAKFSSSSPVFRIDFSEGNSEEDSQVLCDLKFNDCLFRGYPESLRMAHHLSVFDSSAVFSVRSYLSKNYGLVKVPSDDLRATILGKLV
jgi:hypothetical protein